MPTLKSRSFGMPRGYDEYGDALPSFGNGTSNATGWMPSYAGGGMSAMDSSGGGGGGIGSSIASGIMGYGVPVVGSLLSSYFSAKNANKQKALDRQAAVNAQKNSLDASTAANTQSIAARESELDPFRQQMTQASDVGKLDRLERSSYSPVKLNASGPYAKYVPQISGGYSYSKSPELVASAGALKKSVMAGQQAPSQTNPDNYGKTSALDLINVLAGAKDPTSSSSFATGAPSAASSLGADPVAAMIRSGYTQKLGRPASDAEIQQVTGQLAKIYGRPMTSADANLIQGWITNNLATSPEAMQHAGGGFTPSYRRAA